MKVKHLFHSKKGVAIEWAIVFGFVVFGLIAVLMTGMFSYRSSISSSSSRSQIRFELDQIGEYFIRAIAGGGEFPTGAENTAEKFNKDGFLWMDDDAIAFFLEANNLYNYKVTTFTTNMTGIQGFLSFYTENGCAAKLEVTSKSTGEEMLAIIIEEDYDYDVSGLLSRNPILFRNMDGTGTVYQVVEWTVNDTVNPSGTKLNGLQKIWSWIGGITGNRGEATNNVWSITYSLDGGMGTGYVTCPKGGSVTLSTPKKSGYSFVGWHDAKGSLVGEAGASYTPVRSVRLYAKWQINTVTFDAKTNGGQCSVTSKQGAIEQLPEATISDPLMVFDGWYTEKTGGKCVGSTGDYYEPTEDITLYAHFEQANYAIIKFSVNGNVLHTHPIDAACDLNLSQCTDEAIDQSILAQKKGYRFAGWKSSLDGTVYAGNGTITVNKKGVIEMTAQWAGNSVTYDVDGGTITGSYTGQYSGSPVWTWPTVTKTGYKLVGWRIGDQTYHAYDTNFVPTKDVIATAIWQEDSYTLKYVVGTETIATETVKFSEAYAIDAKYNQTKEGHRFDGWTIAGDETAKAYTPGTEFKAANAEMADDTILTPKFTPWPIHFNVGAHGTGTIDDLSGIITVPAAPSAEKDAGGLERYRFLIWEDQNGQQYSPGESLTPTKELTLTAKWSDTRLLVLQYNLNGEDAVKDDSFSLTKAYDPGKTVTLVTDGVTRAGYDFVGWFTAAEGGEQVTSVTMGYDDVTVYAHWTEHTTNATFEPNGGQWSDGTSAAVMVPLYYRQAASTPSVPTRAGFIFKGWSTDAKAATSGTYTGMSGSVQFKAANTDPTPATYYAIWEPISVILNANGGNISNKDEYSIKYSSSFLTDLDGVTVSREGYRFDGWYTAASGGTKLDGSWYPKTAAPKLYAHWVPYQMTFDANGGSVTTETASYSSTFRLPSPARAGYQFDGWYTAEDGGTKVGGAGVSYKPTGDVTLYAHWTGYTITFEGNGGQVMPASMTYNGSLTLPTPTRAGYHFNGWYTAASGGTQVTDSFVPAGNVKLYAHWKLITYTITFNKNDGTFNKTLNNISANITSTGNIPANKYQSIPSRYYVSKSNYSFNGWNTKADATGYHYNDAASIRDIVRDADGTTITLYAEWTYTVSFNENSGNGSMSDQTMYYNQSSPLNRNEFTRTGYHFKGWAKSSYGSVAFTDQQSVKNIQGEKLYAIWEANHYTVEYYKENGTTLYKSVEFTYDKSYNLEEAYTTKKGYTLYWAVDEKTKYESGSSQENLTSVDGGTVKLTAVWVEDSGECFTGDTLITMADGTKKRVDMLRVGEEIQTFDHVNGCAHTSPVAYIYYSNLEYDITKLHFENGTEITVLQAHCFYDLEENKYVEINKDNVADYVGHKFFNMDTMSFVELTSYEISHGKEKAYSVLSEYDINHVANGFLAMSDEIEGLFNYFEFDENMKYDEDKMQEDIETYGLVTYDLFADFCTEEEFEIFNCKYLGIAIGKGLTTYESLIERMSRFTGGSL